MLINILLFTFLFIKTQSFVLLFGDKLYSPDKSHFMYIHGDGFLCVDTSCIGEIVDIPVLVKIEDEYLQMGAFNLDLTKIFFYWEMYVGNNSISVSNSGDLILSDGSVLIENKNKKRSNNNYEYFGFFAILFLVVLLLLKKALPVKDISMDDELETHVVSFLNSFNECENMIILNDKLKELETFIKLYSLNSENKEVSEYMTNFLVEIKMKIKSMTDYEFLLFRDNNHKVYNKISSSLLRNLEFNLNMNYSNFDF